MKVLFLEDVGALFSAIKKEADPNIETLTVLFIVMIHLIIMGDFFERVQWVSVVVT
mgnify:CR=1 FL=1